MAADLGSRLLQAGLVTRAELAQALHRAPPHGGALAQELVRLGVEEDALAGFFLARGFGPLIHRRDLDAADPGTVGRLAGPMAEALLAVPVRTTPGGLLVAMADPSDRHAVSEISYAVRQQVVAGVARVGDLRAALDRRWPELPVQEPVAPGPPSAAPLGGGSEDGGHRETDEDDAMPLVRAKQSEARMVARHDPLGRGGFRRSTRDFERLPPAVDPLAPPPGADDSPPPDDRWGDLSSSVPPAPRSRRKAGRARVPAPTLGDVGSVLGRMRAARDREEVVALACEGAAAVGRCALFFAIRRGTLEGRSAVGGGLSPDAVRNLRIPRGTPSIFRQVVEESVSYVGPHGHAPADSLFKAAIGSRGGDVLLQPIVLSGRTVAVLAVDALRFGERGRERVEMLAYAVGEAFRRIIVGSRTGA